MKTIFDTLNKEGVCYSVGCSYTRSKGKNLSDRIGKDYFIIAEKRKDLHLKFFKKSKEHHLVMERDLTNEEVINFRQRKHEFEKIYDNLHGKVFELKGNSLKSKLKNQ